MTDAALRGTEVPPDAKGRVVFGRMYEDAALDVALLPAGRVLSIASAGDTALELARAGREVVAVDSNPAQIRYVQARLDGAAVEPGSVGRLLGRARAVLARTAWRRADIPAFCSLSDGAEQQRVWRDTFDTRLFRGVLAVALSPASVSSAGFAAFTSGVGGRFDTVMRNRLHDGLGLHPNRDNPYLRALLLGEQIQSVADPASARSIDLRYIDLVEYLESAPAGSFDGFTLSNVADGADAAYLARLEAAVDRCARPGAVSIWRTFRRSDDAAERELAARDRSLFWGGIRVVTHRGPQ